MAQTPPYLEEYTRIELFLPYQKSQETVAASNVLSYVEVARVSPIRRRYYGYTHSSLMPPVFRGMWWDRRRRQWVGDHIVIVTLDMDIAFSDRSRITNETGQLKHLVSSIYRQAGAPQQEIWVIAIPIGRAI